jgi:predicted peptidase
MVAGVVASSCSPALPPAAGTASSSVPGGEPGGAGARVPELAPGTYQETIRGPDGAEIRYTIAIPDGDIRTARPPLIVVLHYAGDVTPFFGRGILAGLAAPAFRPLRAILVAPDSLGGDWTTEQNARAVVWLARAVMQTYAVDPAKVALTGYSMGGVGTWFIGARNQDLFTAAIPVASAPAGGADWKIPLYVIHSRADQIMPIARVRDHVDQLKASGARVEWRELGGLTHFETGAYVPALGDAAAWLAQVWSGAAPARPR